MQRALPLRLAVLILLNCLMLPASSQPEPATFSVSSYDVVWDSPSSLETESMPLGNGAVTLNVWVEASTGDLMYYCAHSASYDENGQQLKLIRGRLHLALSANNTSTSPARLDGFTHRLSLDSATQTIDYSASGVSVNIEVWVDRFHPVARFEVRTSEPVDVTNSIEQWRTVPTAIGGNWQNGYYCTSQHVWPDELYGGQGWGGGAGQLLWWHRNDHDSNSTYYDTALRRQSLDNVGLEALNPLANRTFGGFIRHSAADQWSAAAVAATPYGRNASLTALTPLRHLSFDLVAFTTTSMSEADYVARFHELVDALPSANSSRLAHNAWWQSFWNRSHTVVHVPAAAAQSFTLTQRLVLQRALDAMDGLGDYPIHFNGQGWSIGSYSDGPQGPDLRPWGSAFWWQNVREMYYPAVQSGDWDILQAMFGFYQRLLPVQQLRTQSYYNHSGGVFDETIMVYGLVTDGGDGYTCGGTRQLHNNGFIRYHWDGSLELCGLMVDFYHHTQSASFARDTLLPVCAPILEFFRLHYPRLDARNHTVFYPSQVLESFQCPDASDPGQCVTNSIIFVGGLQYVLSELLRLPASVVDGELRAVWSAQQAALPPLPIGPCPSNSTLSCLQPADSWRHGNYNTENAELYMVWPYKVFGLGRSTAMELAINNYNQRAFPCNYGWCQDVVDAALLGLVNETARQILERASAAPADGWKFPAFVGPMQDSTPAADHYSVLRMAVHASMLQEVPHSHFSLDALRQQRGDQWLFVDEFGWKRRRPSDAPASGTALLLFPTLPLGWDVDVKLLASLNTTVWATCRNNTLERLIVSPLERKSDVLLLGCRDRLSFSSRVGASRAAQAEFE